LTHERSGDRPEPAEPAGFAAFAAAAWPRLVRIAHLLTGDFHEAEDLVQTTLTKVYSRWHRLPHDEIDAYVRVSLVNNNRSRVRKKRVVQLLLPFLPEPAQEGRQGPGERVEQRAVLAEALSGLSVRQRTVLVLRFYEDLSEQEIAAVLNCSVGTVKTHTRRALAALRGHPSFALTLTPESSR